MFGRVVSFIADLTTPKAEASETTDPAVTKPRPRRPGVSGWGPFDTEADDEEDERDIENSPWPPNAA